MNFYGLFIKEYASHPKHCWSRISLSVNNNPNGVLLKELTHQSHTGSPWCTPMHQEKFDMQNKMKTVYCIERLQQNILWNENNIFFSIFRHLCQYCYHINPKFEMYVIYIVCWIHFDCSVMYNFPLLEIQSMVNQLRIHTIMSVLCRRKTYCWGLR